MMQNANRAPVYRNLYLHVPFCQKKCDYCAFYSLPAPKSERMTYWLNKVEKDLFEAESCFPDPLHSIYLGGGTPTLLPPDMLTQLFQILSSHLPLSEQTEISIESNPETVTPEKAAIIASFANRVSMGVQSFQPAHLKTIGRRTANPETVLSAISLFRSAGVKNLGLDFIYGIPGQDTESFLDDLKKAISLGIDHVSTYSLSLEEGSALKEAQGLRLPDDDLIVEMWNQSGLLLEKAGFYRYEISNFAKKGSSCKHNTSIWFGDTYLGMGPSASSFDGMDRFTQVADLQQWLNGKSPEYDRIPRIHRLREIFIMGLRTVAGWQKDQFVKASGGVHWNDFAEQTLQDLQMQGLLETSKQHVRLTQQGLLFWNSVAEALL